MRFQSAIVSGCFGLKRESPSQTTTFERDGFNLKLSRSNVTDTIGAGLRARCAPETRPERYIAPICGVHFAANPKIGNLRPAQTPHYYSTGFNAVCST
jgi:hypothetical protein